MDLGLTKGASGRVHRALAHHCGFTVHHLTRAGDRSIFSLTVATFTHRVSPRAGCLSPHGARRFGARVDLSLRNVNTILRVSSSCAIVGSVITNNPTTGDGTVDINSGVININRANGPVISIVN